MEDTGGPLYLFLGFKAGTALSSTNFETATLFSWWVFPKASLVLGWRGLCNGICLGLEDHRPASFRRREMVSVPIWTPELARFFLISL